jgi:hypothetical protein
MSETPKTTAKTFEVEILDPETGANISVAVVLASVAAEMEGEIRLLRRWLAEKQSEISDLKEQVEDLGGQVDEDDGDLTADDGLSPGQFAQLQRMAAFLLGLEGMLMVRGAKRDWLEGLNGVNAKGADLQDAEKLIQKLEREALLRGEKWEGGGL